MASSSSLTPASTAAGIARRVRARSVAGREQCHIQTSTHAPPPSVVRVLVDLSEIEDARPIPSVGTPPGARPRRQPAVPDQRACLTGGGEVNEGWTPFRLLVIRYATPGV